MVVGVWEGQGGATPFQSRSPWPLAFSSAFSNTLFHMEKLRPKDGERLTRGPSIWGPSSSDPQARGRGNGEDLGNGRKG